MLARCLDRAPAADDLSKVVGVYHDDLVDHGLRDEDSERVAAAIASAGRMAERWPRPVDIIRHLPPKPKPLMLEEPQLTPDEVRENMRKVRAVCQGKVVDIGEGRS